VSRVCADTGFLIALYGKNKNQGDYESASSLFKRLFAGPGNQLVVPWPVLYEAVNTQLVENPRRIRQLEQDWTLLRRQGQLDYLNDQAYRQSALEDVFAETRRIQNYRRLSLTDRVIRVLIKDATLKLDALLTNDPSGFHDVCRSRRLEMVLISRQA
jgi:hypothetical protein